MKRFCLMVFSIFAIASATAQETPQNADIEKNIRETLEKGFNVKVKEINPAGYLGLYEVYADGHIFYTDAAAQIVFFGGDLVDVAKQKSITAERLSVLSAIDFSELDLNNAIKQVKGNGSRKIATFEDPNCGFCKRLAVELQSLKNVTIYTFLYPILGGNSLKKAQNMWCSKDRVAAWNDWILRGVEPSGGAACDLSALSKNRDFGMQHSINGTPTIIFESGARYSGMLTRDKIEENLQKPAKK